jgi:hypothetical protein
MSDFTRRKFLSAAAGGTALAVLKPSELFAKQKDFEMLPQPSISDKAGSLMAALKNVPSATGQYPGSCSPTFCGQPLGSTALTLDIALRLHQ